MSNQTLTELTELAALDATSQSITNLSLKQAINAYITKWSTEIYKVISEEK